MAEKLSCFGQQPATIAGRDGRVAGDGRQIESKRGRRRRRPWRAVAASLLVHATLLALMGRVTPSLRPRPDAPSSAPAMEVRLEREPPRTLPDRAAAASQSAIQPRKPPESSQSPLPPPPLPQILPQVLHRPPTPRTDAAAPLALPSPPAAAAPTATATTAKGAASGGPAAAASARPGRGGEADGDGGAAARRAYGRTTLGCDTADFVRLTHAERERCAERFGAEARKTPGPIDAMPKAKRDYYDAVAAAYRDLHTYKTPTGQEPVYGTGAAGAFANPVTKMPGKMVGVGCGMAFGPGVRDKHKPPGAWVKVGPLLCGVSPPSGFLTEEANIPKP